MNQKIITVQRHLVHNDDKSARLLKGHIAFDRPLSECAPPQPPLIQRVPVEPQTKVTFGFESRGEV